jgi:hypothetical protein
MTYTALVKDDMLRLVLNADDEDTGGWTNIGALPDEIPPERAMWNGSAIVLAPPPVPAAVTPRQMRKAIRQAELKPAVDAFVATFDPDGEEIEAWEYAVEIVRDDPFIAMAVAGLGWSDEQADDLFRLAASL